MTVNGRRYMHALHKRLMRNMSDQVEQLQALHGTCRMKHDVLTCFEMTVYCYIHGRLGLVTRVRGEYRVGRRGTVVGMNTLGIQIQICENQRVISMVM